MSEQDVESLRGAYRDFNAGKPETVLAMADENVEWTEPGGWWACGADEEPGHPDERPGSTSS